MKHSTMLLAICAAAAAPARGADFALSTTSSLVPGGSLHLRVSGGPPGGTAAVFFGWDPLADGLLNPPLLLPGIGEVWLSLAPLPPTFLVSIAILPSGPGAGTGTGTVPVPPDTGLDGFRFALQAATFGGGAPLSTTNPLYVRLGAPQGILSPSPYAGGGFGNAIALGDLTGDGLPDLAVGEPDVGLFTTTAGMVHVYAGPAFSSLTVSKTSPAGNKSFGANLAVGSFDAVVGEDLLVGETNAAGGPCTPGTPGDGAFFAYGGPALADPPLTLQPPPAVGADGRLWGKFPALLLDVDGNGTEDLLAAAEAGATTPCFLPAAPGVILAKTGGALWDLLVSPQACLTAGSFTQLEFFGYHGLAAGDVDGGLLDLFVTAAAARVPPPGCPAGALPPTDGAIYGFEFNAAGSPTQVWFLSDPVVPPPASTSFGGAGVAVGNFDGDAFDDVLTISTNGSKGVVFFGPSLTAFVSLDPQPGQPASGPTSWGGVAAGDVNGDGFEDAVFLSVSVGGFAPRLSIYLGSTSPYTFRPAGILHPGAAPAPVSCYTGTGQVLAEDVDGSGRADVLVGLPNSGPGCTGFWGAVAVYRF